MLTIPTTLTPVLNEHYDEVVLIPSELPIVKTLKKRDDVDLLVIDHRDYDDLKEQYEGEYTFDDQGDEPAQAVFASRYHATNGYGAPNVTLEGWGEVFTYLKESGLSLTDILSDFPKFAHTFQEDTAEDVLYNLDIDHEGMSEEDMIATAEAAIHGNDNMSYITTHKTSEGVTWIVYTQS